MPVNKLLEVMVLLGFFQPLIGGETDRQTDIQQINIVFYSLSMVSNVLVLFFIKYPDSQ